MFERGLLLCLAVFTVAGVAVRPSAEEIERARLTLLDPDSLTADKKRVFDEVAIRATSVGAGVDEARFVGEFILDYPEIALNPHRKGYASPIVGVFTSPATTRAFLAPNPDNVVFLTDLFSVVDSVPFSLAEYSAVLRGELVRALILPLPHWRKWLTPKEARKLQGHALYALRWADTLDRDVAWSAMKFIANADPEWPIRVGLRVARRLGLGSTLAPQPVGESYRYLGEYLDRVGDDHLIAEFLVNRAVLAHLPGTAGAWAGLARAKSLSAAQMDRLRRIWRGRGLSPYSRFSIQMDAKPLLERLFPNPSRDCAIDLD